MGELNSEQPTTTETLGNLIGASRAQIFLALDGPTSTTQLAYSLGLVKGAVGDHLAGLGRAGLVSGTRAGRSVLYRRTAAGDRLIAASKGNNAT